MHHLGALTVINLSQIPYKICLKQTIKRLHQKIRRICRYGLKNIEKFANFLNINRSHCQIR